MTTLLNSKREVGPANVTYFLVDVWKGLLAPVLPPHFLVQRVVRDEHPVELGPGHRRLGVEEDKAVPGDRRLLEPVLAGFAVGRQFCLGVNYLGEAGEETESTVRMH